MLKLGKDTHFQLELKRNESLEFAPARATRALDFAAGTMLGTAFSPDTPEKVLLTWNGPNVVSLELNDLSTFNAMTAVLFRNLAVAL